MTSCTAHKKPTYGEHESFSLQDVAGALCPSHVKSISFDAFAHQSLAAKDDFGASL